MRKFDVTLTFDNGPEPDVTPAVLDTLQAHGVHATFFVLGEKLVDGTRKSLLRRMRNEGHWVGNHTFTHLPLGEQRDLVTAMHEIGDTQVLIGDDAHESRWFRPTSGNGTLGPSLLSASAATYLRKERYSIVLWNSVPRDWMNPSEWVETAVQQCRDQPHTSVVLHDLPTGAMDHLGRFIDEVHALGGQFNQSFPESCVPMERGFGRTSLKSYVADFESISFTEN
jgi:peptidoglycan/xylan/chitin deacetylase (PgdA/CDA1 family)